MFARLGWSLINLGDKKINFKEQTDTTDAKKVGIIAAPKKGQPANPGYLTVQNEDGSQQIIHVGDMSDIQTGEQLGENLASRFGPRAVGINLAFTAEETKFRFRTDIFQFIKALHMARQGASLDTSQILRCGFENRDLNIQNDHEIGEMIEGKGIYLGHVEPGKSAKTIFNMYAAPEDLQHPNREDNTFDLAEIQNAISRLQNWHGHDGSEDNPNTNIDRSDLASLSNWRFYSNAYNNQAMQNLLFNEHSTASKSQDMDDWTYYHDAMIKLEAYSTKRISGRVRPVRFEQVTMPPLPKIF